ncbi:uncharacterized protein LOC117345240 isoform X2 [Pecten maximus]|uniref:uncharacterized protein LOC117345240 isoform X2 n=2 Tax=Pecten maximus TaxID=6579 RepID=UPI001458F409|nr:uncharacterized protein LOC117345240 isoform X2 [Pecten maximus]
MVLWQPYKPCGSDGLSITAETLSVMWTPTFRLLLVLFVLGLSYQVYSLCIPQCTNGGSCDENVCVCLSGIRRKFLRGSFGCYDINDNDDNNNNDDDKETCSTERPLLTVKEIGQHRKFLKHQL